MKETLKAAIFGLVVGAVVMLYAKNAASEPLHHEVQIVSGGAVDAQAFADTVRSQCSVFLGGSITVYVIVEPHPGATTVKVTVMAPRLNARNIGRVRLAIEAVPRIPGVVRNGYVNVRQRMSAATSTTRI